MRKQTKYILAVLAAATSMAYGQYNNIQVRPNPFGGGYDYYNNGNRFQTTRPNPFGRGYDGYDSSGTLIFQTRPDPFNGGGYNIQTMPRRIYRY